MLERFLLGIRPAHIVVAVIGIALTHWWVWSNPLPTKESWQSRWGLEVFGGVLLALVYEGVMRLLLKRPLAGKGRD
jgi:hypothetical protein